MMKKSLFLLFLSLFFIQCRQISTPEDVNIHSNGQVSKTTDSSENSISTQKSVTIDEYQNFYSYEQAVYFYNTYFSKEEFYPKSNSIYKTVYFTNSKRKVFLIYFKNKPTKGYIHEGMEYENWKAFCNSSSPGNFYNVFIKGKKGKGSSPYNFKLINS